MRKLFLVVAIAAAATVSMSSARADMVGALHPDALPSGFGIGTLDGLVQNQAVMLATNQTFVIVSILFVIAGLAGLTVTCSLAALFSLAALLLVSSNWSWTF